jgi:uncharacterized membrane protein YphA (DoxX/SURF4 family)
MNKYLFNIATWLFSLHFIVFGANKFLGFVNPPPPTDPVAGQFLGAMFTSYLAPVVGIVEIVGAGLLLIPRTRFAGYCC